MLGRMMEGSILTEPVKSTELVRTMGLKLRLDYPIDRAAYQEAVATGRVQPHIFDTQSKVNALEPQATGLDQLVDEEQKRAVIDIELTQESSKVSGTYVDEFTTMDHPSREQLKSVLEAFDLREGDNCIRLVNFSTTPLSDEQLRQATNAVRSFADKSGGGVFDGVQTIAILPEEHSLLKTTFKRSDGQIGTALRGGTYYFGLIAISDRLVKRPEDRPPRPLGREKTPFERFGLPGEPAEGPDSPKGSVAGEDFEATLAHELEHGTLPEKFQKAGKLPKPAPTLYGRTNSEEQRAEAGAAAYMGGKDAFDVTPEQRAVMEDMWANYRGSSDGGLHYNKPLGPHFITCQELDITKGPLPLRLLRPNRPIPIEINYHLDADPKVASKLGSTVIANL